MEIRKGDIVRLMDRDTCWDTAIIEDIKPSGKEFYAGYGKRGTGGFRMFYEWLPVSKIIDILEPEMAKYF